jgi:hypothetical protein
VEHATYVFLAPALAAAFLERDAWPRGRGLAVAAFVLVMVLGWGAVARLLPDRVPVLLAALPLGTALYAAWLVGYAAATGAGRPVPSAEDGSPRLNWPGPLRRGTMHAEGLSRPLHVGP